MGENADAPSNIISMVLNYCIQLPFRCFFTSRSVFTFYLWKATRNRQLFSIDKLVLTSYPTVTSPIYFKISSEIVDIGCPSANKSGRWTRSISRPEAANHFGGNFTDCGTDGAAKRSEMRHTTLLFKWLVIGINFILKFKLNRNRLHFVEEKNLNYIIIVHSLFYPTAGYRPLELQS